jgi:TRAP-type uncharacterized transport system substrate-binding protein
MEVQAFQDDKIDVIVLPAHAPSPSSQQFLLTKDIRLLSVDVDMVNITAAPGATISEITADASYGPNQKHDSALKAHGAIVNFRVGIYILVGVVYPATKAIRENNGEIRQTAHWMLSTTNKKIARVQGHIAAPAADPRVARRWTEGGPADSGPLCCAA